MRVRLELPPRFCFRRTVFSHGWYGLRPFEVHDGGRVLETVLAWSDGDARRLRLESGARAVHAVVEGVSGPAPRRRVVQASRRILNLDLDLTAFYASLRRLPALGWIERRGAGRLLRAPTAWEDLVKLVLTTNCSWALTVRMTTALVDGFGVRAPDGARSFPGPEVLAGLGEAALRRRARVGYRAAALARLAAAVRDGVLDPESWRTDRSGPEALRRTLLELPGVGPYVAESLLKLDGRPAGLALDSWLRAKYARVYHEGRRVTDRTIARRYGRLGGWAGLALWCDMTRDWFDGDGAPRVAAAEPEGSPG